MTRTIYILALALVCGVSAFAADTLTITAFTSTVTGYSYPATFSYSGADIVQVCGQVDGQPIYNPGISAASAAGCTQALPQCPAASTCTASIPYDPYWDSNGPHQVGMTATNALGSGVATATPVSFITANATPVACSGTPIGMTIATGTAVTSNWVGTVTVTPAINTACQSDNITYNLFVSGLLNQTAANTSGTVTFSLDTTQFPNSTQLVCLQTTDATNGTHYTDGSYVGTGPQWCRQITFANGAVASQVVANAHDIYCAPGGTFSLGGQIQNTDGTLSSTTPVYLSGDATVATVSSGGLITCQTVGGAGTGKATSTTVSVMAPTISVTNGSNVGTSYTLLASSVFSNSSPSWIGRLVNVTGGTNVIPGIYTITGPGPGYVYLNGTVFTGSSSNATFTTGPTATEWVFDWPTNTQPCIAGNGVIFASYTASVNAVNPCIIMHELFSSIGLLTGDQPYNPGPLVDFGQNFAANWTFELGAIASPISGTESPLGMSAYQTNQAAYVLAQENIIAGWPRIKLYLTGDNFIRSGTSLWGSTNGPAGQWSTPVFQIAMAAWSNYSNILGIAMQDEVNSSWNSSPTQGPITYGASGQSWLNTITAATGTCTASTTGTTLDSSLYFIIRNSAISGMNNTYSGNYRASANNTMSFTFACSGVANATYSATNDPGLILEPYAPLVSPANNPTISWGSTSTTPPYGFVTANAFANLYSEWVASGSIVPIKWPNAGGTSCTSIQNWGGLSNQTIAGVTNIGSGGTDLYYADGSNTYLARGIPLHGIVAEEFWLGHTLRIEYGCYDPSLPLSALVNGSLNVNPIGDYGIGYGPPLTVASASGNTITFTTPHGLSNIIPGMSRLPITGGTDGGGAVDSINQDYLILGIQNATTLTVAMALDDFTGSFTGGTVHFSGGNTKALTSLSAPSTFACPGSNNNGVGGVLCGATYVYSGSIDTAQSRNRGQTFTVTGASGTSTQTSACLTTCNLASSTFVLATENIAPVLQTTQWYHQIPQLAATGGTATIILDNNYVLGRNPAPALTGINPSYGTGEHWTCIVLGCGAGQRVYKIDTAVSAFAPGLGFMGQSAGLQIPVFADTTMSAGQTFINQQFENGPVKPMFHAHNIPALIENAKAQCILQPRTNAPDLGVLFEAGAKLGTVCNMLIAWNDTDAPQNLTVNLTPYLKSGQNFEKYIVGWNFIGPVTTISAGTTSDSTSSVPSAAAVMYFFPQTFAGDLSQPFSGRSLSDVPGATTITAQCAYDAYYLDLAPIQNLGSGSALLNVDKNIGPVTCRFTYLGSSNQVLSSGIEMP